MGIHLTERAVRDVLEIEEYSVSHFGRKVADRYIADMQNALMLLQEMPGLLKARPQLSEYFSFYPAREHVLVCTQNEEKIIVLTVQHAHRDIAAHLNELEPALRMEAHILYERLQKHLHKKAITEH